MPSIIDLIKSDGDLEEITNSLDDNPDQCTVKINHEFPLLIASQYGRLDVVKLLVDNHYITDIYQCFDIACLAYKGEIQSIYRAECFNIALFLLETMEKFDLIKNYGPNLLLIPAQTANFDIFTALLEKVSNINLPNNEYQPLMAAVIGRDPKIVELLLDSGADITLQQYGYTALTIAYKMRAENGSEIDVFSNKIIALLENASSKMFEANIEQIHETPNLGEVNIAND